MKTVRDLVGLWPSAAEFAQDIGIKRTHLHTMQVRGSIPVEYWQRIMGAAERRGLDVHYEVLVAMHSKPAARTKPRSRRRAA